MKSFKQSVILFFGLSILFLLALLNCNLIRDLKDTVIVTKGGAQLIPTLKMLVVPVALVLGILLMLCV